MAALDDGHDADLAGHALLFRVLSPPCRAPCTEFLRRSSTAGQATRDAPFGGRRSSGACAGERAAAGRAEDRRGACPPLMRVYWVPCTELPRNAPPCTQPLGHPATAGRAGDAPRPPSPELTSAPERAGGRGGVALPSNCAASAPGPTGYFLRAPRRGALPSPGPQTRTARPRRACRHQRREAASGLSTTAGRAWRYARGNWC